MPSGVEADATRRHAITADMNLSVLRRLDPAVTAVLCSSSQVAVYELPISGSEDSSVGWKRCEIEGSLYIVSRASVGEDDASHRVVVVNRKSRDNFVDDITPNSMELEHAQQMIMYKNAAGRVLGLWFYVAEELTAVFEVMNAIADGRPPRPPPTAPVSFSAPLNLPAPSVSTNAANVAGRSGKKSKQCSSNPKRKAPAARTTPIPPAEAPPENGTSTKGSPLQKIPADDSLARFFPNLKLSNGVAGESLPANAKHAPSSNEEMAGSCSPMTTRLSTAEKTGDLAHAQLTANTVHANPSVNGFNPTAPVVMPPILPHSQSPLPSVSTQHFQHDTNALMMNMSMLQRLDFMLSGQFQQAMLASNVADVQHSKYHIQHAQNLQRQQMQTRQQIAQLQHQLAMAQKQAMAGPLPRPSPAMPPTFASISSPVGLAQSTPADTTSAETNGVGRPSDARNVSLPLSEEENAAVAGKAITVAGQSFAPSSIMDKGQFRGLLERLLTDNKLFECAYAAHVAF